PRAELVCGKAGGRNLRQLRSSLAGDERERGAPVMANPGRGLSHDPAGGRAMRTLLAVMMLALLPGAIGSAAASDPRSLGGGSWRGRRHAHAGRPAVVHIWGLTCGPCRTEMPEWGKLLSQRPDLNLVTINADLVPSEPGAVSGVLAQTGLAAAENWTFTGG